MWHCHDRVGCDRKHRVPPRYQQHWHCYPPLSPDHPNRNRAVRLSTARCPTSGEQIPTVADCHPCSNQARPPMAWYQDRSARPEACHFPDRQARHTNHPDKELRHNHCAPSSQIQEPQPSGRMLPGCSCSPPLPPASSHHDHVHAGQQGTPSSLTRCHPLPLLPPNP